MYAIVNSAVLSFSLLFVLPGIIVNLKKTDPVFNLNSVSTKHFSFFFTHTVITSANNGV